MKVLLALIVVFGLSQVAFAGSGAAKKLNLRLADSTDVCLANCASDNASCKRVCPTTYNVPCLSACDNQAQACRQSCRPK
jgi:hypothetical protein